MRTPSRSSIAGAAMTRAAVVAATIATGCAGFDVEAVEDRAAAKLSGVVAGHVSLDAWKEKAKPVAVGILGSARSGELASLDLGPILGVGAGSAGGRLKLLGVEIALGSGLVAPELADVAPKVPDGE